MAWMVATLSDADIVAGKFVQLQDAFMAVFTSARVPKNAAIFNGSLRDPEWRVYFSPGAAQISAVILRAFSAAPTSRPSDNSVSLLVGNRGAKPSDF